MIPEHSSTEGAPSSPSENIAEEILSETGAFMEDVKEELIEAKESLIGEIRSAIMGLLNSIFGDFKLFLSVIQTIARWFINPVSLNVKDVEEQNLERAGEGLKPKYFTDIGLMKSIFMLSLTFLVVEETATDATAEHWITQGVFLLFFGAFLFVFIAVFWGWKSFLRINTGDPRAFVGFLIYQYAAIYIVSFIMNGPLGLDALADDAEDYMIVIVYFIPLMQSCYFILRLLNYYEIKGFKKVLGFVVGAVLMAVLLFIPPAINSVFLIEGID